MKNDRAARAIAAALKVALISTFAQTSHLSIAKAVSNPSNSTATKLSTNTTTYCLGRFVIDVPMGSTISGGAYQYDFTQLEKPRPMTVEQFEQEGRARVETLQSTKHETFPSLMRGVQQPAPHTRVIAFFEEPFVTAGVNIEGYRWIDGAQYLLKDLVDPDKQSIGVTRMGQTLAHLRPRPNDHIPSDPGYCFDGGFIANEEWENEKAGMDFRLANAPDLVLSVDIFPLASARHDKPLLERMGSAANLLGELASGIRVLRKGKRDIGKLKGQEYLAAVPSSGGMRAHLFTWETQGEGTLDSPFITIEMSSGRAEAKGNPLQTQLTDAQAIALWDRVVSSLRLRPTGGTPAATSMATPPEIPLGTLAATGRICPRTGWWQCAETGPVQGGTRQYFQAREPMPMVALQARPSLWQRLRGQTPTHRLATVWTLKEGEAPASHADSIAAAPPTH